MNIYAAEPDAFAGEEVALLTELANDLDYGNAARVAIRLRYQGAPFEPSLVPPPSLDGTRESGFGVFMIAESVDKVRYYRDDLRRSCIQLEKRRKTAEGHTPDGHA